MSGGGRTVNAADEVTEPPPVTTVIGPVAASLGTSTRTSPALTTVKVASRPAIITCCVPIRFDPVTSMRSPGRAVNGFTPVMAGGLIASEMVTSRKSLAPIVSERDSSRESGSVDISRFRFGEFTIVTAGTCAHPSAPVVSRPRQVPTKGAWPGRTCTCATPNAASSRADRLKRTFGTGLPCGSTTRTR